MCGRRNLGILFLGLALMGCDNAPGELSIEIAKDGEATLSAQPVLSSLSEHGMFFDGYGRIEIGFEGRAAIASDIGHEFPFVADAIVLPKEKPSPEYIGFYPQSEYLTEAQAIRSAKKFVDYFHGEMGDGPVAERRTCLKKIRDERCVQLSPDVTETAAQDVLGEEASSISFRLGPNEGTHAYIMVWDACAINAMDKESCDLAERFVVRIELFTPGKAGIVDEILNRNGNPRIP